LTVTLVSWTSGAERVVIATSSNPTTDRGIDQGFALIMLNLADEFAMRQLVFNRLPPPIDWTERVGVRSHFGPPGSMDMLH